MNQFQNKISHILAHTMRLRPVYLAVNSSNTFPDTLNVLDDIRKSARRNGCITVSSAVHMCNNYTTNSIFQKYNKMIVKIWSGNKYGWYEEDLASARIVRQTVDICTIALGYPTKLDSNGIDNSW